MAVTTVTDPAEGAVGEPQTAGTTSTRTPWPPSPNLIGALACVALGIVSVLTLPSLPSYDPFSWVTWGHELAHHIIGPHEPFITSGGPSWKPLPVVFTTIFGFFGDSMQLWVAFARAAGLFGLLMAYRLGSEMGFSPRWRLAGPLAGMLAAFGVFLTYDWVHFMYRATSEPITVTATLYAIERHVAGRRLTAFASGVALAMMRPESSPFVGLYALWCFITIPRIWARLTLVAGIVLLPVIWTVPPWISSGSAFMAANHARAFQGNRGTDVVLDVLKRATHLTVWPVIIAAGVATLLAIYARDRLTMGLAAGALAYVAVVEAMTLDHYPGLGRFMLPAAAIAAVLAGVAVARCASYAGGGVASSAISIALIAVAIPFFAGRVQAAGPERGLTQQAVDVYDSMITAVHRAGGVKRIFPCRQSHLAVNHTLQPSLAWVLGVPLTSVQPVTRTDTSLSRPSLAFFTPFSINSGGHPGRLVDGLHRQLLLRTRGWKVYRVTKAGDPVGNACVGGSSIRGAAPRDGQPRHTSGDRTRDLRATGARRPGPAPRTARRHAATRRHLAHAGRGRGRASVAARASVRRHGRRPRDRAGAHRRLHRERRSRHRRASSGA